MITFTIRLIEEIQGRIVLFKLLVNGLAPFDDFEEKIRRDGNLNGELNTIQTRMEQVANDQLLPETKFKKLQG